MSYVSSAGRNGKTCRQDVLRGVYVPVVPGAAGRGVEPHPGLAAGPLPRRAGQHADAAERAVQHDRLFGAGVGPALVCRTHV